MFNLAQGPPAPTFVDVPSNGRFPLPNGTSARLLSDKQNLSHDDTYNFTVQRQLTETLSAEIAYVRNRGEGFFEDNTSTDTNQPTAERTAGRSPSTTSATLARGLQLVPGEAHQALLGRLLAPDSLHVSGREEQPRRLLSSTRT